MEIWELGAVELAAALRARELSAVEALDGDRGARRRARARCTRSCSASRAPAPTPSAPTPSWPRGPAARCAASRSRSRTPTTWPASPRRTGRPRSRPTSRTTTVVAVRRLQEAGAVIFAKTATPEFCYAGTTPGTHNPHDPHEDAGRLVRRRGGRGGRGRRTARARRRRRRLDPHPGRLLRRRRLQAHLRRRAAGAELPRLTYDEPGLPNSAGNIRPRVDELLAPLHANPPLLRGAGRVLRARHGRQRHRGGDARPPEHAQVPALTRGEAARALAPAAGDDRRAQPRAACRLAA